MRLVLALFLACYVLSAVAHPHAWVDYRVRPVLDDVGQIEALEMFWAFDPFYSALLLEEVSDEKGWSALREDIHLALNESDYFIHPSALFSFDGVRDLRVFQEGGALYLQFVLPLKAPSYDLSYQIYEPEYYVEMLHVEGHGLLDSGCVLEIFPANPDEEALLKAAAVEVGEQAELGQFFAEMGRWRCVPLKAWEA